MTTRFLSIADIHLMDRQDEGILGYEPARYGRLSHLRFCGEKQATKDTKNDTALLMVRNFTKISGKKH
jgi:hypothetical protein